MEVNRSAGSVSPPPQNAELPSAPSSSVSSAQRPVAGILGALRDIKRLPVDAVRVIARQADAATRKSLRLAGNYSLKEAAEEATQSVKVNDRTDLAKALEIYQKGGLHTLTLQDESFTDNDLKNLPVSLRTLTLAHCPGITSAGLAHLNRLRLTSVDLSDNGLGTHPTAAPAIADALRENRTLTSVDLSLNGLGTHPTGAPAIADALRENRTLTSLDLSVNRLGTHPTGAPAIADALRENRTLTSVDLSINRLGTHPTAAPAIADALRENRTLTSVGLRFNGLGTHPTDAPAIADALRENCTLKSIDLRGNRFNLAVKNGLAEVAQQTGKTILT